MEYGTQKRSVLFNLNRPEEREMYRFAGKMQNFSGWVRDQLAREMRKQQRSSELVIDTSKFQDSAP